MTYRDLHAALATALPAPVDYRTLKAEVAKHVGPNPLAGSGAIRDLCQLGVLTTDRMGQQWTVKAVA